MLHFIILPYPKIKSINIILFSKIYHIQQSLAFAYLLQPEKYDILFFRYFLYFTSNKDSSFAFAEGAPCFFLNNDPHAAA